MTEAICWDNSNKVRAEDAILHKEFSYFCPDPVCLKEVRPKLIKNAHFFAPDNHVAGCTNEPEKVQGKGTASTAAKKESIVPAPGIPTALGPAQSGAVKQRKPTRDELLSLANSLLTAPACFAGTLHEVVSAWLRIPDGQKTSKQLQINAAKLSYESAFYSLDDFGEKPISELPCNTKIIHGEAQIKPNDECYWINSKKAITAENGKLKILIRVPRDNGLADRYIADLLATHPRNSMFTLFYFGEIPKLSFSGKTYVVSSDISDDYRRFVLVAPN